MGLAPEVFTPQASKGKGTTSKPALKPVPLPSSPVFEAPLPASSSFRMPQSPSRHRLPLAVCLLRPQNVTCQLRFPVKQEPASQGSNLAGLFLFGDSTALAPAASWPWLDSSKARMRTNDRDKACLCSHGNCCALLSQSLFEAPAGVKLFCKKCAFLSRNSALGLQIPSRSCKVDFLFPPFVGVLSSLK